MKSLIKFQHNRTGKQEAFTIMEVVVATTIFAVTVTLMLTLFNLTLRIQRRTEVLRQVSQTLRNVGEFLAKEVRNGQVDYSIQDGQVTATPVGSCPGATGSAAINPPGSNAGEVYNPGGNSPIIDRVGIINLEGERECIAYDSVNQKLTITKEGIGTEDLTPPNVKITLARFYVRPAKDPYVSVGSGLVGVQPMVTIILKARVLLPTGEVREVAYQTSVSTSVYNIPTKN